MTDDAATGRTTLFLVWTAGAESADSWPGEVFALAPGLHLVKTTLTQSRLYHRVKRRLPEGAALLVATLETAPKHKGLAAGALAFVRAGGGKAGGGHVAASPEAAAERLGLI